MNATAHIVNPYTNQTEGNFRISGVQADCPVIAEVVSTVLILASPDEATALTAGFTAEKGLCHGQGQNQPTC